MKEKTRSVAITLQITLQTLLCQAVQKKVPYNYATENSEN